MWVLPLVLTFLFSSCQSLSRESQVVVYTSVDDVFARPICEQFTRKTGIEVLLVPDTEETKSAGLINRLIAEKQRPRADVFWSGDPVRAELLKAKGISEPYYSPSAEGLPQAFRDTRGFWTGFSGRARVIIYNKNLVAESEKPHSIFDFTDPRFRGKACIANPLFGTTSIHAAALFAVLGDSKARKFFEDLSRNQVAILSSNGEVRRRVSNGDFAVGLTDTDDANVARIEGKPIGVVWPDQRGPGTLFIPNAVVLIRNGPHLNQGRRFIDYLLQPEIEEALARSQAAQIPLRKGLALPAGIPPIDSLKTMTVNYSQLASLLEELSRGFLKDWVDESLAEQAR